MKQVVVSIFYSVILLVLLSCGIGQLPTDPNNSGGSVVGTVATPVLSPTPGTFPSSQSVTITCSTTGATIYYTTDGSAPTTTSSVYTSSITISATSTLKAVAARNGMNNSTVVSGAYTITGSVAPPAFSPVEGCYASAQTVSISSTTPGASIYYTTDGSVPTTASTLYLSAITVSATTTLKAIAVKSGWTTSSLSTALFTISLGTVVAPTYTPSAGTYTSSQSVVINCGTLGATIYYTTDGSSPTISSLMYSSSISVNTTQMIRAFAVKSGWTDSDVGDALFTINIPGMVNTVAGSGVAGYVDGSGASAVFNEPSDIAIDSSGIIYISDLANHRIRKMTSAGIVSTFAGSGSPALVNGAGTAASFNGPSGIAVDASGNVYVADMYNHCIRKITSAGDVTTIAGSGSYGYANGTGTAAKFNYPSDVAVDSSGNIFVADRYNLRVRKITSAGVVTTFAGSGDDGCVDSDGIFARFSTLRGITIDGSGNLYVADTHNNRIRKITSSGSVTTLAGSGTAAFADGTGSAASFNEPFRVAVDSSGNIIVADTYNNCIRKITGAGVVSTLAGSTASGYIDGAVAASRFSKPIGVAVDSFGNIVVADLLNYRIRRITP